MCIFIVVCSFGAAYGESRKRVINIQLDSIGGPGEKANSNSFEPGR